jgi:site-specific DNA-cytosine methylase
VLAALTECGYHVTWKQYDACKLIPQSRLRVYIVGIRNDLVNTADTATSTDNISHPFCWPILPDVNPTIGSILHQDTDDGSDGGGKIDTVDLEQYRLTSNQ